MKAGKENIAEKLTQMSEDAEGDQEQLSDSFENLQLEARTLSKQDKSPPHLRPSAQYVTNKINHSEDNRSVRPMNSTNLEDSTLSTSFSKNSTSRSGGSKVVVKHQSTRQPNYLQSAVMNRSQIGKDFDRNYFDYPTCKYNDYNSPQHFEMESHRVSF